MERILTPHQMQALDTHFMVEQGIPGPLLMEQAAMGVTHAVLMEMQKKERPLYALIGSGNNGGDGLASLRQLKSRIITGTAILLSAPGSFTADAKKQYDMACACGIPVIELTTDEAVAHFSFAHECILIDALFGTGLIRPLAGRYLLLAQKVNAARHHVIAVDIPSGVDGASGQVWGEAIRAQTTVTFQHKKYGHLLYPGRTYTGNVLVTPIGAPTLEIENTGELLEEADIRHMLGQRAPNSHKGNHGRALLIAGSETYTGAAILSARAALRAGCGLLYAAVPRGCMEMVASVPAAIVHPCGNGVRWDKQAVQDALPLLDTADAIAIGPGISDGDGLKILICAALLSGKPLVLDADALNLLSRERSLFPLLHENVVLTPHPGEMARLLKKDAKEIGKEPVETAVAAAKTWGCIVHLKGAVSVTANDSRHCLTVAGNAGLAKGGSGDVLTGILLGLLSGKLNTYDACCAAAFLLGTAADTALKTLAARALLPTDVIDAIHCG